MDAPCIAQLGKGAGGGHLAPADALPCRNGSCLNIVSVIGGECCGTRLIGGAGGRSEKYHITVCQAPVCVCATDDEALADAMVCLWFLLAPRQAGQAH